MVNNLNANDMLFLKLYYEKELPPEEIAEILNLTVSTVYSKKNRIREKLQKIAKKKNLLQDNWVRIVSYSGDRISVVAGTLKQECI